MIDRLVFLGWVLTGSLIAAGLSLGIGWLVGQFWVGFAVVLILGILGFLFGDRIVERIHRRLSRARSRLRGRSSRVASHQGRHRRP